MEHRTWREEGGRLLAVFESYGLRDLPIPGHPGASKNPMLRHRGGQYTRSAADRLMNGTQAPPSPNPNLGILLIDLIVLDFDDGALYHQLLRGGVLPAAGSTPLARTKKGYHVFFRRSPLANELQLTDNARVFYDASGRLMELDVKTVTRGELNNVPTAGFLAVYPSPNKGWVVDIGDCAPMDIPDTLVRWLVEARRLAKSADRIAPRKRKPHDGGGRAKRSKEAPAVPQATRPRATGDRDMMQLLRLLRFPTDRYDRVDEHRPLEEDHVIETFKWRQKGGRCGTCHMCGEQGHTDSIRMRVELVACPLGGAPIFKLFASHYRNWEGCRYRSTIGPADTEAHVHAFERGPRLDGTRLQEVRSKLAKAGAVADASAINAAWPLEDAAPGFVACAAHTRRGWVLLLEDAGCAAWWRDCRLPGLRHELLAPRRWWTAANDAAKVETAGLASWAYAKSAPRGH